MYAYIKGILSDVEKDHIVIENSGIGYNINIYSPEYMDLPGLGEEIQAYTYTSVAEDHFTLYGFLSKEELNLFRLLISVNGVGPKSAQAMLAILSVGEILSAIASQDVKTISKTPGLGAKTAGRLINDLKDKVDISFIVPAKESSQAAGLKAASLGETAQECITALVSLGYSKANAVKAVQAVEGYESMSSEELIKQALKNILIL